MGPFHSIKLIGLDTHENARSWVFQIGMQASAPHSGARPFHQKSAYITQWPLRRNAVQIWLRATQQISPYENRVAHRVVS